MNQFDLREAVVDALRERAGSLRIVSERSGVPYDTVLRVKNGEGDPGYSKVRTLADFLGIRVQPVPR